MQVNQSPLACPVVLEQLIWHDVHRLQNVGNVLGAENPKQHDTHYEQGEEACYKGMKPVDYSLRPERDET